MYPVELYRTVQADRHARLGRLVRRARRTPPLPPGARSAGRPITVTGPSGDVVLTSRGVTLRDPGGRRPTSGPGTGASEAEAA